MNPADLIVLYEDNHLLAVAKPPGLATMGVNPGEPSLAVLAKEYLRARYDKPGNVYLGIVSRLDAVTSGAVVFARTSKAARRLTEAFGGRDVEKIYWAAVDRALDPAAGRLTDWIRKDEPNQRMTIASRATLDAREAQLRYRTRQTRPQGGAVLEIALETGRKHQIRAQLAHRGSPILGDRKYGSKATFPVGIALHSRALSFEHPVRRAPITIEAPTPPSWEEAGVLVE